MIKIRIKSFFKDKTKNLKSIIGKENNLLKKLDMLNLVIILLCFFSSFYYFLVHKSNVLDAFLNAAAISGFVAMITQYFQNMVEKSINNKIYKICFICKKSNFSIKYFYAIQDKYVNLENVHFTFFPVEAANAKNDLLDFFNEKAKNYDGIIFRPFGLKEIENSEILTVVKRLKKTKLVLIDIDFSENDYKIIDKNIISEVVKSDFRDGGKKLGDAIKNLFEKNNLSEKNGANQHLILFLGPESNTSAMIRCKELIIKVGEKNLKERLDIIYIEKFDFEFIKSKIEFCIENNLNDTNVTELVLFLGNDDCCRLIMKDYVENQQSKFAQLLKKYNVIFIGYDGLKNDLNEYVIHEYNLNSITIDVDIEKQGRLVAETMIEVLNNKDYIRKDILVETRLVEKSIKYKE